MTNDPTLVKVMEAARGSWAGSGEHVTVKILRVDGTDAHIGVIKVAGLRVVEYFVTTDEPALWDTLAFFAKTRGWTYRAVVPLPLMGPAHNNLIHTHIQLQGWWVHGNRISFGTPEIA